MTTTFVVDNSVIQRLGRPTVRTAWDALTESGEIATCLPIALEAGYSARNVEDHAQIARFENGGAKLMLPPALEIVDLAISMQSALFQAGKGGAVGVSDLQIAATAVHHARRTQSRIVIVHYDSDFEQLAAVFPELDTQWIVPRGSVD